MSAGAPESVALLVRHASAGDPSSWDGPDALRPLDDKGIGQAGRLVDLLSDHSPVRIVSAPAVRCRETVAPLAARTGLAVAVDPLLGEEDAPARPEEHLLELLAPGQTVVLCSQGGVIPRILHALTGRPDVSAPKGSVWVLAFDGRRLVSADMRRP